MMNAYVVLLRGINVGGKNKVSMAELRAHLEALGFAKVATYIASGNVVLQSDRKPGEIKSLIEESLPKAFKVDDELIKVLVLSRQEFQKVFDQKPDGFGEQPDTYHSDAIFLMDLGINDAMAVFSPKEGVDRIWPGDGVVYSQRLSAQRTKSRLNRAIGTPEYKSMTIRSWGTTQKILEMLDEI